MMGIDYLYCRLRRLTRERSFLIGLLCLFFLATTYRAAELRLDLVPDRLMSYLTVATSDVYFGHKADYAGYTDVARQMNSTILGKADQNSAFKVFLKGFPPSSIDRTKEFGLEGSDDKGLVDFFRLSLGLFGLNSYGFLLTYFLILAISLTAYTLAFYEEKWPLWGALFFLVAHWVILPNVQIDGQLQTIYSNRFFPVVGLIATLHLILAPFLKLSPKRQMFTSIVQCLVLIFVAHIRTSALWEIGCAAIVSSAAFALIIIWRGFSRLAFIPIIPVVLLISLQVASTGWVEHAFSNIYKEPGHMTTRSVWHSILTGFSFSPTIREELGFQVDDQSVRDGVEVWLKNSGRADVWRAIQGDAAPGISDHYLYEQSSKEYLVWVVRNYPFQILKGILLYKPVVLAKEYLWLNGFLSENANLSFLAPGHAEQVMQMTKIIRSRPRLAAPLYWVAAWVFLLAGFINLSRNELRNVVAISLLLLGLTLIPTLGIAFPLAYSSSEAILAITIFQQLFYACVAFGLAQVVRSTVRLSIFPKSSNSLKTKPASTI